MKVVVKPNNKVPIRGILAKPFVNETVIDLTEMQIKRVLNYGAKVYVTSLDGIKAEIKLDGNGNLDTSNIKDTMDASDLKSETDHTVDTEKPETATPVTDDTVEEPKPEQQHMTKAQRRAARRAEQQKAAEEAAKKEAQEANEAEDEAKDNAEVIEPTPEEN